MGTLLQDLRFALRSLWKNRLFTVIATVTLALGIGGSTAIFSVVHAVLIRSLPYAEPERLALIWTSSEKIGLAQNWVSEPEVLDLREQTTLLDGIAVFTDRPGNLTGTDEPEQITIGSVSAGFFDVLGVQAWRGRTFRPDEDRPGEGHLIVLSKGFWSRRFGGDEAIVGQSIELDGQKYEVTGILPDDFKVLLPPDARGPSTTDAFVPYAVDYAQQDRLSHGLVVYTRMKPGVTLAQVQAELDSLAARIRPQFYESTGFDFHAVPLHGDLVKHVRPSLLILFGAVGFVLLIACANVANLLLAQAIQRRRELAIRAALGASRWHIVRQLLTESVMLGVLGGGLGILLAFWGLDALIGLAPSGLPRLDTVRINLIVLGFAFGASVLTGLLFGLLPVGFASRPDLNDVLKEGARGVLGGRSGRRLRGLLVIGQVALSLTLLVCAALLLKSFSFVQTLDPGFRSENVLTLDMRLPQSKYAQGAPVANFYETLVERVRALPGVEAAGAMAGVPLTGWYWSGTYSFEGTRATTGPGPLESFEVDQRIVTPGALETLGATLLRGRWFTPQDIDGVSGTTIIDETLAERVWPGEDPVGKRIAAGRNDKAPHWYTVIGVVRHIRHHQLQSNGREQIYFSHRQRPFRSITLLVKSHGDPLSLVPAVREAVRVLDPDQPVQDVRTLNQIVSGSLAQLRFTMVLSAMFGLLAAVLAAVGIYGVIAHSVRQLGHEIAVRMALGASVRTILVMVVGLGARLAAIGIVLGALGSLALGGVLQGQLFGVSASDPTTLVLVSIGLGAVAMLACTVPARRAMKIEPMAALRHD